MKTRIMPVRLNQYYDTGLDLALARHGELGLDRNRSELMRIGLKELFRKMKITDENIREELERKNSESEKVEETLFSK